MLFCNSRSSHTNSHWMLNNCMQNVCSYDWPPICRVYELLYPSKRFEAAQFQSHNYIYFLNNEWSKSITFQRFWNAIHVILINLLIIDIFRLTPSPILIQLSLLDIHNPWYGTFRIAPLCIRSEWTIVHLDISIITARWSLFIRVSIAHGTLLLWLVWHHWLIFCQ